MKPYLKSSIVASLGVLVGGITAVFVLKMNPTLLSILGIPQNKESREMIFDDILNKQKDIRHHFDSIFNDDFFRSADPFYEMKKTRDEMQRRMNAFKKQNGTSNPFDSWYSDKFGGGSVDDIAQREDDGFVYYDIKIRDLKSTSVNTKVENGYITITGTFEKRDGTDESSAASESIYKSTFRRTFPLPDLIEQDKMEMIPEKDKVVLKFPKIKA